MLRACVCGRIIAANQRRCAEHERAENSRRAQKAKRAGIKTGYWRKVRLARLQLDGGLCTFRLDGCTGRAETVHLDPALGGDHSRATMENTRSACRHCHGVVDAPRSHRGGGTGVDRDAEAPPYPARKRRKKHMREKLT
jgi:5-methylcytosine-specific restriction endonuclease McrA